MSKTTTDQPAVAVVQPAVEQASTGLIAAQQQVIEVGFGNSESYALAKKVGTMYSESTIVPETYRKNIANCMIAVEIASRVGMPVIMVMQNLHIVMGRPSWSSPFLIAMTNNSRRFTPLRFEWVGEEGKDNFGCQCYAKDKESGEVLTGSPVTIAMAKAEGWFGKNGSKWPTMPKQMLMYRSAAFFVRIYAPDLSVGLHTVEEQGDIIDVESRPLNSVKLTRNELPAIEGPTE
jgi:hypothetical protein